MKNWIPKQHGAWAMLIAPIVAAMLSTGLQFIQILLLIGWLSAYCFNYYLGLTVKSWRRNDRWTRYRSQQISYGLVALLIGLIVLGKNLELIKLTPVFVLVFAVNLIAIKQGEERNWINDLLGILLSVIVGGIAVYLVDGQTDLGQQLMLVNLAIYFIGTVWYVKTNIREKGKSTWLWLSVLWHLAATTYGFTQSLGFGIFFLLTFVRALIVPSQNWTPKKIGILEIFFTITLLALTVI